MSKANGFYLDSAAAGVAHTADQLANAPGVMLQNCVQRLRVLACMASKDIAARQMATRCGTQYLYDTRSRDYEVRAVALESN